ncbi:MAG: AbrB family transcriptional regulator [Allorhizobium sp.]
MTEILENPPGKPPEPGLLTRLPLGLRWLLLLALSALLSAVLEYAGLPAALLLGPMIAGILFGTNGARMHVPRLPYLGAQALLGCLIASTINADIVQTFAASWPLFLAVVLSIIAVTSLMGFAMARMGILPGTTAVWGTSAGAASAMLMMAEAFGADARLVAFMQYLRVVCVASTASVIAAFVFHIGGAEPKPIVWFPAFEARDLALTLLVAVSTAALGARLRIPAATMLLPMAVAAVLHATGLLNIVLPPWLLASAYALLGWRIGLGFTRRILGHAAHALPQIMVSIVVLIALCGGLAVLLVKTMGVDPLTAYLATSPGGLDSIAIIAASTPVDVPFVMALQTVRLVLILMLGPPISRLIARHVPPDQRPAE